MDSAVQTSIWLAESDGESDSPDRADRNVSDENVSAVAKFSSAPTDDAAGSAAVPAGPVLRARSTSLKDYQQ